MWVIPTCYCVPGHTPLDFMTSRIYSNSKIQEDRNYVYISQKTEETQLSIYYILAIESDWSFTYFRPPLNKTLISGPYHFKLPVFRRTGSRQRLYGKSYWIVIKSYCSKLICAKAEKYFINQKPRRKLYYSLVVIWPFYTPGTGKSNQPMGVYSRKNWGWEGRSWAPGGQYCKAASFPKELLADTQHSPYLLATEAMFDL